MEKQHPKPKRAPEDVSSEYEPSEEVIFDNGIENTEWVDHILPEEDKDGE